MFDIITIGSATADIFMKSAQFHLQPTSDGVLLCQEYGGKIDVDQFELQSGGAGTNTAVGFSRLGFKTATVVEIGKDVFAQVIWDDLKREKVNTDYVVAEKTEETAVSALLISAEGGRSALTHRGAASMLEARDLPWDVLNQTRWIHLSNVGANMELLSQLFTFLQKSSVGLSWNPGRKELELLAEHKLQVDHLACDILVMNKEEWQIVQSVQHHLLQKISQVIVTDGRRGGELYLKGQYQFHYTCPEIEVVQETGAGDAFTVGFVSAHLLGKDPQECSLWGVKNAASVVKHMGAKTGLLRLRDFGLQVNEVVPETVKN